MSVIEADRHAAILRIEPEPNGIGAEVSGIDLAEPLGDAEVAALTRALAEHKVLFFRDQHIDTDQHIAFARHFGPLEVHPFAKFPGFSSGEDYPELIALESKPERQMIAEFWHSDVSWRETPSLGSVLRITHCPEAGGDTLWADMAAAYDGLDDATRSLLSGLVAIHDWHRFRNHLLKIGSPAEEVAELVAAFPPVEHPLIRTHPETGRKIIYVNTEFTVGIKGMAKEESDALLHRLYTLADNPDHQARMRWRPGSVAMWDNRSTQHSVVPDVKGYRRVERVTIAGDRPF